MNLTWRHIYRSTMECCRFLWGIKPATFWMETLLLLAPYWWRNTFISIYRELLVVTMSALWGELALGPPRNKYVIKQMFHHNHVHSFTIQKSNMTSFIWIFLITVLAFNKGLHEWNIFIILTINQSILFFAVREQISFGECASWTEN